MIEELDTQKLPLTYATGFTYTKDLNKPCYWVNDKKIDLNLHDGYLGGSGYVIYVDAVDVYVAGHIVNKVTKREELCLWADHELMIIDKSGKSSMPCNIVKNGDTIYISTQYYTKACLFIVRNKTVERIILSDKESWTGKICLYNNRYYVLGAYQGKNGYIPCFWKDNLLYEIPNALEVSDMTLYKDSLYICGQFSEGNNVKPCYWENLHKKELPIDSSTGWAEIIKIIDDKLVIFGKDGKNWVYWIDGVKHVFNGPTMLNYNISKIFSIDGKNYITALNNQKPNFWINGKTINIKPKNSFIYDLFLI